MAFVDGSSTIQLGVFFRGQGTEQMASPATVALSLLMVGDLVKVARIKRAKATSPTRVRVDFTAAVDNNAALVDVDNWTIYSFNGKEFQPPTIHSVEVPSSAGATTKYVVLVLSEMHSGACYALLVNSATLGEGPELINDGDMEAVGLAQWTAIGSPTYLLKNPIPGGTAMSLGASATGDGFRPASSGGVLAGRAYMLAGTIFGGDGIPPLIDTTAGQVIWLAAYEDVAESSFEDGLGIGGHGNYRFFFIAKANGTIQFKSGDSGGETNWDNLSLKHVYGVGNSTGALITAGGIPLAKDVIEFIGIGVVPKVKMVIATSEIDVTVYFTERLATDPSTLVIAVASFTWNLGLTTISIEEIGPDFIRLRTTTQTGGALYQLTISGATIVDLAGNQMVVPVTMAMLGFLPGIPVEAVQRLRIYMFLLEGIRQADQDTGAQFVERFLKGPQAVWEATTQQIMAIPLIWNLELTPDTLLQYIKDIVGWTAKFNTITGKLPPEALRRLISVSVPFWKQRGIDDIIEDILRMVTGTRVRVLDWFWYRWILGETQLGEDHDGIDPWLISTPGQGPDAQTYVVRIVDDGKLDYAMIRDLLKLTRPLGERVEVYYVAFHDDFPVDNDNSQWSDFSGVSTVLNRHLRLLDDGIDEEAVVSLEAAVDWTDYTATFRIQGTGTFFMDVYRTEQPGQTYAYRIRVNTIDNLVTITDTSGGGDLDAYYFGPPNSPDPSLMEVIQPSVNYTFRVTVTPIIPDSSTNDIKVYWEANMVLHVQDAALEKGSIAVGHLAGGTVELSEVEMFLHPMKTDLVDINS